MPVDPGTHPAPLQRALYTVHGFGITHRAVTLKVDANTPKARLDIDSYVHWTMYNVQITLCCKVYTVYGTLNIVRNVHTVQCKVYSLHNIFIVLCALYIVQSTSYSKYG